MIVEYYSKLILQNFSTRYYLLILMTGILINWLFQLTNQRFRTNDSSPLRSLFFIPITKYLNNRRKVEVILCFLITLFILNIYFANHPQNTLLKLLSLLLVILGSIKIVKILKKEKQVYQELEALDKRKSDFLADIAHKLKTPLTITRMNIDLAKKEIEDNNLKEAKESAIHSMQSVDNLARLCTNLITLGKIDFGISKLNKKEINFSKLVESSTDDFKVILGNRKLTTNIEPNIKIFGDSDRLQEMILNLLDNAVKFTDEEKGKIEVTMKQGNSETIILTISDNGIGIDEAVLPNLFSRYYQVESRSGSAGIGLSIVKWIALGHDGTIEIKSKKGEGTMFKMIF